ncbi:MAG: hypothetical protein MR959_03170 [Selenomonas bovis]|nr:hypothetical protein [Selenomonas bovis]
MSKVVQFNENQIVYSSRDGERYRVPIGDKYEVSVISTAYSYGGKMGLYEIALIKAGKLVKLRGKIKGFRDDDVLGYLTENDVRKYIEILREFVGGEWLSK